MDAKFTPGPWLTKREGFSSVYVEARIGGGMIQEVAMCGPTESGQVQQEANANLIAAAPDLLEAAKTALGYIEAVCFNTNNAKKRNNYADAAREIRAAISKATGEPQ